MEHLLGRRTRTTVRFRRTVHNFGKTAAVVKLRDQVPVSEVDRIAVALVDTSLPPVPDAAAPAGVLGWSLSVPGGGSQSVELCFSVTAPRELQARMEQMLLW